MEDVLLEFFFVFFPLLLTTVVVALVCCLLLLRPVPVPGLAGIIGATLRLVSGVLAPIPSLPRLDLVFAVVLSSGCRVFVLILST